MSLTKVLGEPEILFHILDFLVEGESHHDHTNPKQILEFLLLSKSLIYNPVQKYKYFEDSKYYYRINHHSSNIRPRSGIFEVLTHKHWYCILPGDDDDLYSYKIAVSGTSRTVDEEGNILIEETYSSPYFKFQFPNFKKRKRKRYINDSLPVLGSNCTPQSNG
jgi:hypothetical protein